LALEILILCGRLLAAIITKRMRTMPTSKNPNPGNFANDRTKASEAGRKGGKTTTTTVDKDSAKGGMGRKGGQKSR
jgi:general stress protein YciG